DHPSAIWIGMASVAAIGCVWAVWRRKIRQGWGEVVSLAVCCLAAVVGLAGTLHRETPPGVEVIWMFEVPERGAIVSSPLVVGDQIFVGVIHDTGVKSRGAVYCVKRDTRRVVWSFDDRGKMLPMYSSPCLANGRILIGEGMHSDYVCKLYCLDAQTG